MSRFVHDSLCLNAIHTALACTLVMLAHAAPALAEPRTHDGIYFQGGFGPGFLSASESRSGQRSRSFAMLPSLFAGGTPFPGFVLGGGLLGAVGVAPSGKLVAGQPSDPASPHDPSLSLALVGAIADYYLNPRGGFHLQAIAGYAELSARQSSDASAVMPRGVGFALGVGQEAWLGDDWSVGVLARFALALPRYQGREYPTLAPGLVATFTCH